MQTLDLSKPLTVSFLDGNIEVKFKSFNMTNEPNPPNYKDIALLLNVCARQLGVGEPRYTSNPKVAKLIRMTAINA